MQYRPGLHILCEVRTVKPYLLQDSSGTRKFFDEKIKQFGLEKLGEVYHDFDGGGYTGVVCLTESHIAIHTWPEFEMFTFDIYLSNFRKNNDDTVRNFFREVVAFFGSENYSVKEMQR